MKRYIHFIPIAILVSAMLYSLYVVNTTNIILGTKQYFGIAFIIGSIVLSVIRKDFGICLTGVTLLLGTLNVIAFTPTIESYSFGVSFNDKKINFFIASRPQNSHDKSYRYRRRNVREHILHI